MNTGTRARTETLPSLPNKSPAGRQVLEVLTGPGLPLQELAPAVFLALPSAVATTKTYLQRPGYMHTVTLARNDAYVDTVTRGRNDS